MLIALLLDTSAFGGKSLELTLTTAQEDNETKTNKTIFETIIILRDELFFYST